MGRNLLYLEVLGKGVFMITVPMKVYSAPREIREPSKNLKGLAKMRTYEVIIGVNDVPQGIPIDPNPRKANPKGKTYTEIIESLNSNDGLFHKKNKGMTLVVGATKYDPTNKILYLSFRKGSNPMSSDGILDGGHTYKIIKEHCDSILENQFVKATIMEGVPPELIPEISSGLNNSTSLKDSSKMNHKNKFEWIKRSLKDESYAKDIIYFQNDDGSILVEDIIALMTCMNIDLYPSSDVSSHPIIAYSSKASCLSKFADNEESYKKFEKILPDVLELYDCISIVLQEAYNDDGGKAGLLSVYNSTKVPLRGKRRYHKLAFTGIETYHRLEKCVNLAVLASFRTQLKTIRKGGQEYFVWKKGIDTVHEILEKRALYLMDDILNCHHDVPNINQLGKSKTLWSSLLKTMRIN